MAVEEYEFVSGHREPENGFQDNKPGRPGIDLSEPRKRTE